jgi:adenosylcobyric acid synthase
MVLVVFGWVAVLVGAFVIANTFSILVAQRTRELALLRALGASRLQVFASVLGEALIDPHGIDGNAPGLGLLPLVTVFAPDKTVRQRAAAFATLHGAWAALSNVGVHGYEIHHGQTAEHSAMAAAGDHAQAAMPDGLAWQNAAGNVLGVYLHGLFEDPAVLHALFGAAAPTLDAVFDGLADVIDAHFAPGVLSSLID